MFLWVKVVKFWVSEGGENHPDFYSTYGFICLTSLNVWMILNFCIHQDDILISANRILHYFPNFTKKWMRKSRASMKDILKYSQRMDKHVFLQVSIMLILPISPTTFVISSPDHPLAPKQLLPQKFGINVHLLPSMACIMMVAWAAMVSWYAMMLFVVFGTLYMIPITVVMQEFDASVITHHALSALRTPPNLMREYVNLQLVHKLVTQTTGPTLVVMHVVLFCNFTVLANWDTLDISTLVILALYAISHQLMWAATLQATGMLHFASVKTLESWKAVVGRDKIETNVFQKFRKSMKPLSIGMEGVKTFNRLSAPKFKKDISVGTFRALLTLSKNRGDRKNM
ncbi:uncharacterized protein LOC110843210 [Folsomia candida]|nr:uncharacterized protein LOC110843210 [Folsomia candida]